MYKKEVEAIYKLFSDGKEVLVDNMFGFVNNEAGKLESELQPELKSDKRNLQNKKLRDEILKDNFRNIAERILIDIAKTSHLEKFEVKRPEVLDIEGHDYKTISKYLTRKDLSEIDLYSMGDEHKEGLDELLVQKKNQAQKQYDEETKNLENLEHPYIKDTSEIYEFSRRLRSVLMEFNGKKNSMDRSAISERFMNKFGANYGMTHIEADLAKFISKNRQKLGYKKGEFNENEFILSISGLGIDTTISVQEKEKVIKLAAGMISSFYTNPEKFIDHTSLENEEVEKNYAILSVRVAEKLIKDGLISDVDEKDLISFGKLLSINNGDLKLKLGDSISQKVNEICDNNKIGEIKKTHKKIQGFSYILSEAMSWLKDSIFRGKKKTNDYSRHR